MQSAIRRFPVLKSCNTEKCFLWFILFSIFLLPDFNPFPKWFAFRVEDILLPVVMLFVIFRKDYKFDIYAWLVIAFAGYILFTIMINNRATEIRDYFEIFKLIKYLFFLWFFMSAIDPETIKKPLRYIFIILLVFNLLHYYNVFEFNRYVECFYASDSRLLLFGKDSLGEPATKRLMGTMGNPNNNAILFLFFAVMFVPGQVNRKSDLAIFFLSFLGIMLTQSRTGMVAFVIITVTNIFLNRLKYRLIFKQLLIFILIFFTVNLIEYTDIRLHDPLTDNELREFQENRRKQSVDNYLPASEYLTNIIESDVSERSVSGRLEAWKHLWTMIKEKPFFGYSPYKDYFYDNSIYPESEYILMTWRYGFIGLFLYLVLLTFPVITGIRKNLISRFYPSLLFLMVVMITALMNTPFCEPRILLLLAFTNAMVHQGYTKQKENYG